MENNTLNFKTGLKDGLPIGLGYFPVSFAFGVQASLLLVPPLITLLISMTNLTSAGQLAGLDIVASLGSVLEAIIIQLVINSRYFLMSLTLTQKIDKSFTFPKRLFFGGFITDEIFAVASSKKGLINTKYFSGLIVFPYILWAVGTIVGAVAGNVLPTSVVSALGIALYAMFIAIICPPSLKSKGVLLCVTLSAGISCAIYFIPVFKFITSGFAVIISALLSSLILALLFPVKEEEDA